ncbi:autotransporter domain-containing protein (plasmid) [Azospirillum sp. A26]|uniref:autotransporter domain-containing protein n=1 Tax=Azospirillum sp. A26 TaxID=3160607 RepID=UPI00367178EE
MLTVSARKLSALRWTLLAGASMIVMAGVLGPMPADAVTNTITGTTLSTMQTVTGGNSLSITSTGTVSPASAAAIYVTGTAGSLWNDGAITPASGSGIVINGSATITSIHNTGSISGTIGLETSSNGRIGTITNSGTIAGTSVGVTISSVALGTLTNSGLIQTSGVNGALALNGTTSAGSVLNSGTGTLTSTSGYVFSVTGTATSLTLLDTAGLIKGANGVRVQGTLATLTNSGTIQGTSGNALSIASTGTITSLSNTGVIAGNINDSRTTGLTIAGGTGTIYGTLTGGTITNAGTITSSGGVTFTGNIALNSNVSANSGTGTVTNTGTLYTARATTIAGSYTQPSGAELQLGVVSTSVYGALNASAGLTLTNGSVVMMAAPSGTLAAGTYTIASGGTVGTDYTNVTVTAPSSGLEASTTTTIASNKNYLVVTLSQASRLYWDGDTGGNAANSTVDGGNGTWSSAGTNWTKVDGTSNGTLTGSTITPFFQGTAGTVTVSGSVSAAGMTFATNGYLLTGGTIGLGSPAATIVVDSGVTATIASSLTGGGVYKNGAGELVLSGVNGIGNNSTVNAGTLTLMGGSALPDTKAVAVNGDGTLKLGADETVGALTGSGVINLDSHTLTSNAEAPLNTTMSGSITGTGGFVKANTGRLTLSGTGSYTGGTTITGGTLTAASATALASTGAVSISSGATFAINTNLTIGALSGAGDVALGSSTLTAGDAASTTLSGVMSGTGGFTKAGSGTLTLSGANSYTGSTTIGSGTLAVTGTIGSVSIAPGATLSGTGTVGALTNYGTLALGSSALTVAGNINGTGAITFTIGSGGTGYIVNTTNTANYTPGAGTVTVTPTLSGVTLTNGATVALIRGNSASTAPSFTGTTLSVVSAGSETWTAAAGTAYVGTVDLNGYTIAANDTVLVANVTSPPPPPPPPPVVVTTPTTPEVTTPVVVTPTTPEVTTPTTSTTPTTPVVTTPTTPTTPTVTTGVIDGSQPTFTNEDGAVQATTVTFDGGTLKPTAPLTLTQTVKVEATNGVINPNGSTVTLSGSITGAGQLTVNGSGTLVVSSSVSNSGGLSVQSGDVTVAGGGSVSAPVTVSGGAVTVEQGGSVSAPVTVGNGAVTINSDGTVASSLKVESGGSAKVNGEVTGAVTVADGATLSGGGVIGGITSVSGILAPGNSPGTLFFTAPVTLNASSVYQVEIDGTGTGTGAGNHDQVVVAGASFTAGGRLTPVLRGIGGSATNSFTPSLGQSFTVVTADGGVAGRFATLDQPAGGLAAGTRLDLIYGSRAIALVATPASYADLGAAGLAQSANQRAVGAALESFRPVAGGQAADATAQALFDNLHSLSGDRIGPALNQLSGEIHADTLAADRANRRRFGRAVEARQAAGRGTSGAPGPVAGVVQFLFDGKARSATGLPEGADGGARAAGGATGLWGQPLVGRGRSGGDGGAVDRFTGGFMVGSDHAFDPNLTAGVALGFLRTRVKADGGLGKGTVDSYQATAYGSWTPGAAFVDAALGYGHSRYETSRSVVFGAVAGAASGEADGDDLSAELSAGVRVALDGDAWVEPRVGLRWDRLQRGSFTETGTPLLGLSEEAATQNALRSSLALRAGTRISLGETAVEPTGLLGWEHDWRGVDASATGVLNGARFTVRSSRPGRDAAVVGAGVNVAMTQRLSLQVGYLGEIRRRDSDHGLSAGLRWSW